MPRQTSTTDRRMSVNGMVRPTSDSPGVASVCRGRQWFSVLGFSGWMPVLVLRGATGKPVTQYLEEKIWQRIGTENDATWILDVSGQETGHGLISASLRDWARLGRLLANDGNWEGQVIPKSGSSTRRLCMRSSWRLESFIAIILSSIWAMAISPGSSYLDLRGACSR
jgi:hypothetical protein